MLADAREPLVDQHSGRGRWRSAVAIPGTDSSQVVDVRADRRRRRVLGIDHPRELRARARVRRGRGAAAADRRREHGRRAGERAPVRRDAAPAEGNRAAQRRAGGHQQHPAGHGGASSTSRPSSTWSATSCARCFNTGDIGIRWCDDADRAGPSPLRLRARRSGCALADRSTPKPERSERAHPADAHADRRPTPQAELRGDWTSRRCRAPTWQPVAASVVPIIGGDRLLGAIALENYEREHAFGDSDVRLLQTVAATMGVALENARLFDETQRRAREASALAEVGRDLSSSLDLATVMDRIAGHAKELLQAGNSAIFLPDPTDNDLPRHRRRRRGRRGDQGDGRRGRRRHHRQPRRRAASPSSINDTDADPRGVQIPGTDSAQRRAPDGRAAARRRARCRARWRCGAPAASRSTTRELQFLVGLSRQASGRAAERAAVQRDAARRSSGRPRRPRS